MEKLTLGLLEPDEEYVRLFASYLRLSPYRDKCILKVFTRPENALADPIGRQSAAVLLASPAHAAELYDAGYAAPVILLSEDDAAPFGENAQSVMKYQPLNLLLDAIWRAAEAAGISAVRGGGDARGLTEDAQGRILVFYSAVGGCGKTTVAANLARLLAYRGHRVLYASLEGVPSAPVFPCEEENAMERLLYLVKSGPEALAGKVERVKHHDPRTKVDYLLPPGHPSELEAMTEEDASVWLNALKRSETYDYILLDLDSTLHPRVIGSVRCCDELIWIITDNVHCVYKTRRLFAELSSRTGMDDGRLERKTTFLLNKYTGSTANDLALAGLSPDGLLPYVPGWKGIGEVEALFSDGGFQEQLVRWFYAHHEDAEKRREGATHAR